MSNFEYLLSPINKIKGVGKKTLSSFNKKKIFTIFDLLWHLPISRIETAEDTEIDDYKIPKGSKVAILLGSANRDSEVFDNPSELNFNRENKDHSSWGGGIHFCIGAHLARFELEVSFKHLLKQNLSLKTEPERTGAFGIRGYKNLLVGD